MVDDSITSASIAHIAQTRRIDALFKAMASDFLLREQFVTDPAQVLSEFVYGAKLSPLAASVSNQLLYAVMCNLQLLQWLRDYAVSHRGHITSSDAFMRAFGRAVTDHGGRHVVFALIRGAGDGHGVLDVERALLPVLFGFFDQGSIFASGTEMSTGTRFGTEQSGTMISSGGGIFADGTEMSTGTQFGTEQSGTMISSGGGIFADGTEMSTGTQFGTEQSGTMISSGGGILGKIFGGIFSSGTEMSTGTQFGTEQSGTMVSSAGMSSHVLVTLEALAQHADRLRALGALENLRSV